ncbi:hypothetical protein V498_03770 [Pseudogymnoascus sp. VKM F-4517 (FW-2822)]|nr:hypothetical protein V498_03770 [Pseudogymnoascus sp. VKM F-4517 (FW-2822)]
MGNHVIPEGTFYTYSPQIKIRCQNDRDEIVLVTLQKEEAETDKGGEKHCFLRPPSNEERDKHLARLQGVERMDSFLRQMEGSARVYFHGFESGWNVSSSEHPCGKLSYNDKLWSTNWDRKHLSRYGLARRLESSCIPLELGGGMWHKYSCGQCIYCNGKYVTEE